MKVVIVDDRPENRYLLETLLHSAGHEAVHAVNGNEALNHVRSGCDLVVSDVLMPQMDGFTLCREMKADHELCNIPVVFYTATYTDAKDAEFGLSLGAERYLIKPVEPQELLRVFTEVAAAPAKTTGIEIPTEAPGYFRQYNSRLITKLEQKSLELEAANQALKDELANREKLEIQLRHAQKLDAVGRLAGGIAHDFNNILGGILGHAELARMEVTGSSALSHLDGICSAAHRARDLVHQILTFSRHKERVRKPMHLHTALEDALKLLRASIPASIEIRCTFDSGAPSVMADLTEIHQIATNLVTNGWHAIGDVPGTIELKTDRFHVDADFARTRAQIIPGDYVRLSISDTGCGMDARTQEHIFDPFFTTKPPGKGSGLGLSVVHGIMASCGGAITAYSEVERGTVFHLYFPAVGVAVAETSPAVQKLSQGSGQRVLLVDDDSTLTVLGERFLKRLGYECEVCTNPISAMTRFREAQFDLVITDLTMPYATGMEVAAECHKLRPDVPIILMTGYSPILEDRELGGHGIVSVLQKPYSIEVFGEAISSALRK